MADSNLVNLVGLNNSHTVLSFNFSDIVRLNVRLDRSDDNNLRLLSLRVYNDHNLLLGIFCGHHNSILGDSGADLLDLDPFRYNISPS